MNSTRRLPMGHGLQRAIGRLLAPLWAPILVAAMRFGMAYRIADLGDLRQRYRRIRNASQAPLLICANHLTMIDSLLVAWALSPVWRYCVFFDELPWNLPERRNFATALWARISSYVTKCIPITRGGPRAEVSAVLNRVAALTERGEVALIFPEGGRSRSGRVDVERAAWGVGRIVGALPGCRVLCVYMRGREQKSWGVMPKRGELLEFDIECIEPKSDSRGVRRSRDFARQIVAQLASMERKYFDDRE